MLLILDKDSSDWPALKYDRANRRPDDEQRWYDILKPQSDDVVHWWQQLGLSKECLATDLKRMSTRSAPLSLKKYQAPLLAFKNAHKVLFECLHATFGMMMSNSRLCE